MTKSAHTRASLLPYPIIAAAVAGDAEAVSRVVRHYSSYIAALSTRTSYDSDGYPRLQVDEELRNRLEAKTLKKQKIQRCLLWIRLIVLAIVPLSLSRCSKKKAPRL